MKLYRAFGVGVVCALAFILSHDSGLCAVRDDALSVAQRIQKMIEQRDVSGVQSYLAAGICFGDDCYSRDEVSKLFDDEQSWLFKGLFDEKDSLRAYMLGAEHITISIHEEGGAFIAMYHAKASERPVPPDIALICREGKWFMTDVYEL